VTVPVAREFVRRLYRVAPTDPIGQLDLLADDALASFNNGKSLVSFSHQASSTAWQVFHSWSPSAFLDFVDFVRSAYERAQLEHNTATPSVAQTLNQLPDLPNVSRPDFS
jgi:hypothetical protein